MQKMQRILVWIFILAFLAMGAAIAWQCYSENPFAKQETLDLGPATQVNIYSGTDSPMPDRYIFTLQGHVDHVTHLATLAWSSQYDTQPNRVTAIPIKITEDGWEAFAFCEFQHPVFFQKTADTLRLKWGPYFEARGKLRHRVEWPLNPERTP